jgi:hypothetical protein
MTNKYATTTSPTNDKAYFTESQTAEVTKPNSLTLPVGTSATTAITTVSTDIEKAVESYQQSAHKVVVKRYAIKRG